MKTKRMMSNALAAVSGVLALVLSSQADAAMVAYQDTGFAAGDQITYFTQSFTINDPGTYKATLADFKFPASMQELGLTLTTDGTREVNHLDAPGSFDFSVTAPKTTFDANLYALAGGTLQLGLFGVSVISDDGAIVPTPLPPAALLLASALLVLAAALRRARRSGSAMGKARRATKIDKAPC